MSMFHSHVDLISGWYLVFYVKRTPSCLSNNLRGKKLQCISSVFFPLLGDFWRKEGTELHKIYVVTKFDSARPSCSFARFFAHALPVAFFPPNKQREMLEWNRTKDCREHDWDVQITVPNSFYKFFLTEAVNIIIKALDISLISLSCE